MTNWRSTSDKFLRVAFQTDFGLYQLSCVTADHLPSPSVPRAARTIQLGRPACPPERQRLSYWSQSGLHEELSAAQKGADLMRLQAKRDHVANLTTVSQSGYRRRTA
jgi:hypothetical protein